MKVLLENEFSEPISNRFICDHNLTRLRGIESKRADAIVKLKPAGFDSFRFKVKNHCGYLTIGNSSYFILPKAGEAFLRTMLSCFRSSRFSAFDGSLELENSNRMFDEFVAHLFIGVVEKHIRGNLRLGYYPKTYSTLRGSGRLNIAKSKVFLVSGEGRPSWDKFEFSRNTKLNKAMRSLFKELLITLAVSNKTQSALIEIADFFSDSDYAGYIDFEGLSTNLDRLHEHYRPLVDLAANFNVFSSVQSGTHQSRSLLIPTWQLFEGACRSQIGSCMPESVVNVEGGFTKKVSDDCRNFLDPDIVIRDLDGLDLAAGDCKYVNNPSASLKRDHLFQVNAYMDGYRLPWSFVIYPAESYEKRVFQLKWDKSVSVFTVRSLSPEVFKEDIAGVCEHISSSILKHQAA